MLQGSNQKKWISKATLAKMWGDGNDEIRLNFSSLTSGARSTCYRKWVSDYSASYFIKQNPGWWKMHPLKKSELESSKNPCIVGPSNCSAT